MKSLIIKFIPVLILTSLATSCGDDFTSPALPSGDNIVQIASSNDSFDLLTAALNKTGLAASLSDNNSGTFTVFAPTDGAFVDFFKSLVNTPSNIVLPPGSPPAATLDEALVLSIIENLQFAYPTPPAPSLPNNVNYLTIGSLAGILNYHVVSSKIPSSAITGNQVFTALNNSRISFSVQNSQVLLNANINVNNGGSGAMVTDTDIQASNGIVHIIDKVMRPPSSANIWVGTNTGTIVNLPAFTVNYGVSPPEISVFGTVVPRNISGDGFLNVSATATGTGNSYNLISAAIARAELATTFITIATPFPDYTLFAPTDAAFIAYLGAADETAARTAINALSPTALANILKYHVVAGRILSTDLTNGQVLTTLAGTTFSIGINGSVITIIDNNPATDPTISIANTLTNAGVIHQLNGVLRPN